MDWLRWHHGTVEDAKLRLAAKRAKARVCEAVAMWAACMEAASKSDPRGSADSLDFESIDLAFEFEEGTAARLYAAFQGLTRPLISPDGRLIAWEKRQPKREREDTTAAERKRRERERNKASRHVTPSHAGKNASHGDGGETGVSGGSEGAEPGTGSANSGSGAASQPVDPTGADESRDEMSRHVTPRGEERRVEEIKATPRSVDSTGYPPASAPALDQVGQFEGHDQPGRQLAQQDEQTRICVEIATALRARNIRVTNFNPKLIEAVAAGARLHHIADLLDQQPQCTVAYLLGTAAGQARDRAAIADGRSSSSGGSRSTGPPANRQPSKTRQAITDILGGPSHADDDEQRPALEHNPTRLVR